MRKIVKAVSQVWGESCESQHICPLRTGLGGYPAWIRTKNNASKGRCVTVTPRGNPDSRFSMRQRKLQLAQRKTSASKNCRAVILAANKKQWRRGSPPYNRVGEDYVSVGLLARLGQTNINCGTASVNTGDGNLSAVRLYHRPRDGEPEAGPACLPVRYERLEKFWQYLGRNANAGVGNAQHNSILHQVSSDGKDPAANHRFA